jgi:hypothetical protein
MVDILDRAHLWLRHNLFKPRVYCYCCLARGVVKAAD